MRHRRRLSFQSPKKTAVRLIHRLMVALFFLPGMTRIAAAQVPLPNNRLPMIAAHTGADFWVDGVPPDLSWPEAFKDRRQRKPLVLWGSWCDGGMRTGELVLGPFTAPERFSMLVSGLPFDQGNVLKIVRESDRSEFIITRDSPGHAWELVDVKLPADWIGKPVELVAFDVSDKPGVWLGLSEPFFIGQHGGVNPLWRNRTVGLPWHQWLTEILGPLLAILLIVAAVGITGYSLVRRFLSLAPYFAPLLVAAVAALCGYIAFWAYVCSAPLGHLWVEGLAILAAENILLRWMGKRGPLLPPQDWVELKWQVPLLAIASLLYLGVLWLPRVYGISMDVMASRRATTWCLSCDNVLQQNLSQALHDGNDPRVTLPPPPPWQTSDRPPLEAGVQLLTGSLVTGLGGLPWVFNAQINGMVFQLTWIFGLWALLRAIGCSPRAAFQIVLCLIPTGVLYANSIFVWPKLCAASFALGMTAMLCFRDTRKLTLPEAAVAGVLLSLGMLCHSGIFFFVLPVLGLWVVLPSASGRPGITAVLVLILMSGTLFYPWTRYQKDYDPPGNHLLKLSFAGVVDDDSITTWKSIQGAYSALTGQEILRNKQANFITPFKGNWSTIFQPFPAEADHSYHSPDLAEFGGARGQCRFDNFFFIFRSCGVLLLGLFALPLLIRPANAYLRRPVLFLTTSLAISLLLWCLLMFGPGTTIIHAGAYGVPLVILTLLALLIRSVHPLALLIVGVYNFVQFIWVYAWMYPYPPRVDPLAAAAILLAIGISIAVLAFGLKIPRRANARAGRAVVAVPTAT